MQSGTKSYSPDSPFCNLFAEKSCMTCIKNDLYKNLVYIKHFAHDEHTIAATSIATMYI